MRKLVMLLLLCGFAVLGMGDRLSYAGEIDILLDKLVEKGILTPGEAQEIGVETKEQVKKEIAEGKFSSLPAWVQNTKLKGDFRLRYQFNHAKDTTAERQRGRFRLRLGVESKANEKLLVGFGLATGLGTVDNASGTALNKDYARSTNQSFSDAFSKKPVTIDYAFAQYTATPWATFIGGKFKNPLWEPGDLLWDSDINPEGAVVKLVKRVDPATELFFTPGLLIIDEESATGHDPIMGIVQAGVKYNATSNISVKGAFSYYNFMNIKNRYVEGGSFDTSNRRAYGNTRVNTGTTARLKYGYNTLSPAFEVKITEPLKLIGLSIPGVDVPYFAVFGEYVINTQVSKKNTGFMPGFKFGSEKIEKWGDWQAKYNYAYLAKDAIPDFLPDSDRYEGTTGIRGHEFGLDLGLGKNTWLSLDGYRTQRLTRPMMPETVFQADWNIKF
ncbi:MAG: putative porin [Candidatus Omnitrophica bacterium]|nr:putative porin [Candidatus Omnitrophota bacterium]MDD5654862.1 putative porin [Candidatus Omnitrophota bacterium]